MSWRVVVLEEVAERLRMRRRFRALPAATEEKVLASNFAWIVAYQRLAPDFDE